MQQNLSCWRDEKKTRITHPDWHTPSWLTLEEAARAASRLSGGEMMPGYSRPTQANRQFDMLVGCMRACEQAGFKSRLIFWFDN